MVKNRKGAQIILRPTSREQNLSHDPNSVTTVWHRVVSDRPGHVTAANNNVIEKAAILIFCDYLDVPTATRHVFESKGSAR